MRNVIGQGARLSHLGSFSHERLGPADLSRSLSTWAVLWFYILNSMLKAENALGTNIYFTDLYLLERDNAS